MEKNINQIIQQKISEIENAENVKILHCIESGSRAWGFASPDSDYDVRFIYVRPLDFYLKLEQTKDVIEWQLDDTLDINGWDLQKTLRLLYKSNPTVFEWNNSPIIYKTTNEWASLKNTVNSFFNVQSGFFHYINMAKSNYKAYFQNADVKLKKYFYVIRPILACKWILEKETPPPVLFSELVEAELEADMLPIINKLIEEKAQKSEIGTGRRIDILDNYIEEQIKMLQSKVSDLSQDKAGDMENLNSIFKSILFNN